jgi:lipoyl synthase
MIGVSAGTAAVLGLRKYRCDVRPETAYLMLGEGCRGTCLFCAQSSHIGGSSRRLSRITWPQFPGEMVVDRLVHASGEGLFKRICLQMVNSPDVLRMAQNFLGGPGPGLRERCGIPVGISSNALGRPEIESLFGEGMIDSLAVPLDAATPHVFREIKGEGWEDHVHLLLWAAEKYPHRIATHLMVGIGESEEDLVNMLTYLYSMGIRVGIFAFTPLKGTPLAGRMPPSLSAYRRLQLVHHIIKKGMHRTFTIEGGKVHFPGELESSFIAELGGDPFETSGCPGCNRPYYNERPGGIIYNYPRVLTKEEVLEAYRMIYSGDEKG